MTDCYPDFLELLKEKGFNYKRPYLHGLNKPSMLIISKNGNREIVYYRYSKEYRNYIYWFGIEKCYLENLSQSNCFVIFVCGSIDNIFKIPANFLIEKLRHVSTAIDNNYKFHINKKFGEFRFKVPKGQEISIEEFRFKK